MDIEMQPSQEMFLEVARFHGIDITDHEHMEELYGHVKQIMRTTAALRRLELEGIEPAHTFHTPVNDNV